MNFSKTPKNRIAKKKKTEGLIRPIQTHQTPSKGKNAGGIESQKSQEREALSAQLKAAEEKT